jgi:hypothetical protein
MAPRSDAGRPLKHLRRAIPRSSFSDCLVRKLISIKVRGDALSSRPMSFAVASLVMITSSRVPIVSFMSFKTVRPMSLCARYPCPTSC